MAKRTFKDYIKIFLCGVSMGSVDVIPGVSGGTMAFILGIYEELISSIRKIASADTIKLIIKFKIKELYKTLPWPFLLAVLTGILTAIISFAKLISYALQYHKEITFAFFFGLIIASIITVIKKVKKWSVSRFLFLTIGVVIAYLIVTLVPVSSEHVWWNIFFSGMIAICAMILPGISGSFLLLILGQYQYVLDSVNTLVALPLNLVRSQPIPESAEIAEAITAILAIGAGAVAGLSSFVHLLNWLFKKFHDITVATLIGFMVGSLWKLWPWQKVVEVVAKTKETVSYIKLPEDSLKLQHIIENSPHVKVTPIVTNNILPPEFNSTFFIAISLAVFGFFIVMLLEKIANKNNDTQLNN